MGKFLAVAALVGMGFFPSSVFAEGKYYAFLKDLQKQEISDSNLNKTLESLVALAEKMKKFKTQCQEGEAPQCKKLLQDVLKEEISMAKLGRQDQKTKIRQLHKAIKDLEKL